MSSSSSSSRSRERSKEKSEKSERKKKRNLSPDEDGEIDGAKSARKQEDLRMKRLKIREECKVKIVDKKFLEHLAQMHPTSALHEICQRMEWPTPNMAIAFECGPPMYKMYIFKAVVNGITYQPTVALDNKKEAKANAAWFALQEMGFVKPDPANPL